MRYRNLVVRQATQVKNRMASTLMENGVDYSKAMLHHKHYFADLVERLDEVPDPVRHLLRQSRAQVELFQTTQRTLLNGLSRDPRLAERVSLLETIPGVGQMTALTWALETGTPQRFSSVARAQS